MSQASGCKNLELDRREKRITCVATLDNIELVLKELDNCCRAITGDEQLNLFGREIDCSSCFTPINGGNLRLENCGHLFCMDCLALQMTTYIEAKRFPIGCAADHCDTDISVCDIMTICNRSGIALSKLVEQSLNYHLARNKSRVKPCPTRDCPMFYNVTSDPEEFRCPKCKVTLCSACHEVRYNFIYFLGHDCVSLLLRELSRILYWLII